MDQVPGLMVFSRLLADLRRREKEYRRAHEKMEQMRQIERKILGLRFREDLSYQEISRRLRDDGIVLSWQQVRGVLAGI